MSVDRTTYLLYGFKFTKKEELDVIDDNWEDLMWGDETREIFNSPGSKETLVYDGMCGNYAYIGIKLAKVDDYWGETEEPCIEISQDHLGGRLENQLYIGMESWPSYLQDLCKDHEPGLYLFIHYS